MRFAKIVLSAMIGFALFSGVMVFVNMPPAK